MNMARQQQRSGKEAARPAAQQVAAGGEVGAIEQRLGPDAPVRHSAKRRRIKTVMQELIYRAGRLIEHGRRLILGLGANDRAAKAFARLHGELFAHTACT